MKTKYVVATLLAILVSVSGCDKGFEDLNKNPLSPTTLDPVYELVTAEVMAIDQHHYPGEMAQQLQLIIGGQEAGGSRNVYNDNLANNDFNAPYNRIVLLVDVMNTLKGTTSRTNLYNMARILKAYNFMILVDTYGDAPYTEAGLGYLQSNYYPKYDKQQDIYTDLEKELKAATDALDATKDKVTGEFFFKGDIPKWKKFGNSLLLRLGMRYSKSNPTKAQGVVQTAVDPTRGGVMTTNADDAIIPYNATQNNPGNTFCTNSTKQNWHVGKPFVDFLFANKDPRMRFIICLYSNPNALDGGTQDTITAHQIGCPYGYDENTITSAPGYPGTVQSGVWKYSQINRKTCGRVDCWSYMVTAAQTQLLMAEATQRGWINTGSSAASYYNNGITQALSQADIFATTSGGASPITTAEINSYLARPNIAYNGTDLNACLNQINTQYWLACFLIWNEAWCNLRRSGYPVLTPMNYPGQDASVTSGDGFIHRLCYTTREGSINTANVKAAATSIGGDNLGTRVFWDTK